jgi:carboxypeptidase Taq
MAAALTRSDRGFIRVGADEATYDAHICLRFGLEVDLIKGDLKVADVPSEWNRRFKELFGLDVPDDARGCLQDIHWSMGSIGYFATYTLGNLLAAQLMDAARSDAALSASIAAADYAPLLAWLRDRIHRHGSRYTPGELIPLATGKPLGATAFLDHLRRRYTN